MNSNEIRRRFTEFFAERDHLAVPSSSLVPHNDPTVLLTTAGMQQMTPYFLNLERPPHPRMTSIQKCFRTVDIDEVGDESHLTFFEMMGNFSVGDYFKADAISWAWELLTEGYGIPAEKWYPTVHHSDEFSFNYWRDVIGFPEERIRKLGDEFNWWGPVGDTGPNGPDSEIYYDLGPEHGCGRDDCGPNCEHCDRFLEVWNLVFMEFFKEADGSQTPLPRQNIDTGMGIERLAMILQGKSSVFETDLYLPILERAADLAGVRPDTDQRVDRSLRVMADHARAVTFLIADGVFPGNEGRSYVLRRVLRRAVRHGRLLGLERAFLTDLTDVVISMFAEHYPDLSRSRERIHSVVKHEEENFSHTLSTGISRFETLAAELRAREESEVPGAEAFRLYDTYGFPFELTEELATDEGFTVDRDGFAQAMAGQRDQSRARAARFSSGGADRTGLYASLELPATEFRGYTDDESTSTILAVIGPEGPREQAEAGDELEIVLASTPFYAESGGQVGDTGVIETSTGIVDVADTQRPIPELIVHRGTVRGGFVQSGQEASARIDATRRTAIRRNHTATHLLHAALRRILGDHVHQAGSLVAPDRLRFDFTNLEAVPADDLRTIQDLVNSEILADTPLKIKVKSYQEATAEGAMALFGEKYGDRVRVVEIPGFSKELCGGTHVGHTAEIGLFVINEESSVASGVRRIEALTGSPAVEQALEALETTQKLSRTLHVPSEDLQSQVTTLTERLRNQERAIERLQIELLSKNLSDLDSQVMSIDGVNALITRVDAPNRDAMLQLGDRIRDRMASGVIVLGAVIDAKPALLVMVTRDLVGRGLNAGKVVGSIAPVVGGRGGGRPDVAQGGGTDASKLDEALNAARQMIEQQLAS